MLLSMTGFGRGSTDDPQGRLIVEIQSVNRKYLEIFVSLPKEFSRFEHDVRKWVGESVSRGQVSVRIHWVPSPDSVEKLLPEVGVLKRLKAGWEKISQQLGFDSKEITLSFLMEHIPLQPRAELSEEAEWPGLHKCVGEALESLMQMKRKEGRALGQDLEKRLQGIAKLVDAIEKLSPEASGKMRQKLTEKMSEALQSSAALDERIFREVALFAEKVDITEELTRLRSHFVQFEGLLQPKGQGTGGRKMDFLIQEMGREINTIGSKSLDAQISHLVVDVKSELEKMREQIQNLE